MLEGLQKSPNYNRRYDTNHNFPFHEGFPKVGPDEVRWFRIFIEGRPATLARVDFSTQYRAEGTCWKTVTGETIKERLVFAWEEYPLAQEMPTKKED